MAHINKDKEKLIEAMHKSVKVSRFDPEKFVFTDEIGIYGACSYCSMSCKEGCSAGSCYGGCSSGCSTGSQ